MGEKVVRGQKEITLKGIKMSGTERRLNAETGHGRQMKRKTEKKRR